MPRIQIHPRLFPRRPLAPAVATGMIWSLCHLPLNLRRYNSPDRPLTGMVVFSLSLVSLSIILGWLQEQTQSVRAPSLAHAATTSIGTSILVLLFFGDPEWILLHYTRVLAWIPLAALSTWILGSGRLRTSKSHFRLNEGEA